MKNLGKKGGGWGGYDKEGSLKFLSKMQRLMNCGVGSTWLGFLRWLRSLSCLWRVEENGMGDSRRYE